jgi:hypothetical protein
MSDVAQSKAERIISVLQKAIDTAFSELDPWFAKDNDVRLYHATHEEWNIHQILEHVSLVNHYLMMIIDKGARKAVRRSDRAAIERELEHYELSNPLLEDIGINNSFKWKCPGHMVPTGTPSPDRTRAELLTQKSRLMEYLAMLKNGEGVLCKTVMSVHSLGKLDVYQYIYFLLKHAQRHIQQMKEIEREYNEHGVRTSL